MKINITFFALLLSTILAINTVYSQSFPDGLVSWWRLDQNSGTTVTDKVTGASGEVVNDGTEWIEGFNGNALDFSNAVDSAVVIIEDSEDLQPINFTDQSFSVSILVNLVAFDPTFILIKGDNGSDGPNGNGQRYAFEIKDTELRFVIDDNITKTQLGVSVPGFPLNEWAHIVGVRDRGAGSLFLYLNGTEIGNMVDATGTLDLDSMRLLLGNYHHLEGKINGAIDEVMIFDTVLTAAEVAALKDSILNYVEPDIFTYSLNTSELIVGADGSGFTSLDSTWSHDNGNDTWDGSAIGEGSPGGISTIDGYLRFQDTGNPTSHGMPDPSNRKLTMVRDIGPNGGTATMLNDGATLFFRTRLATDGLLDAIHPDGGGALTAVPSAGDGYVIHNGGVGMIGIHQSSVGLISFTLVTAEENNGTGGLMMNSLNGTTPSENVNFGEGTANVLELDPTVWHDFWITIQADGSGVGTHQVDVSVDSGEVQTFIVTAGSSASFADISTLRLGVGATDQSGAFDIAAFKFAPGVNPAPVSPVDKPVITFLTDDTNDDYQIAFLERQGCEVKKFWPQDDITTWAQEDIDMLNNSDLIICGRSLNSSEFEDPKKQIWNSLTAPLIMNSIHAGMSTKINWFNTIATSSTSLPTRATITDPADAIFNDVSIDPADSSLLWFPVPSDFLDDKSETNGTKVVTWNDYPLVVRFEPNVEFYPGAGDSAAGPRVYFPFGIEPDQASHFPLSRAAKTVYWAEISRLLGITPSPVVYGATEFEITFLTDDTNDDFQIHFLKKQGLTVKTAWPQDDITTWAQEDIDMLNNSDLIICGRSLDSSEFEDPKKQVWNSITAPLIMNSIHAGMSTKINWFNTAETSENTITLVADVKLADDPILKFAPGIIDNKMDWVFPVSNILTDVDSNSINGEVVLTFSDGTPLVVRFEPNTEFYPGAVDVAAGPRTYFAFGAEPASNYFPLTINAQAVYFAEIMRMLGGEIYAPIFSSVDNTLSWLSFSAGSLTPMFFHKNTLSYDLALPHDEYTLTVNATASVSTSTITSGPGTYVILNDTTITITCASEIGQERSYTFNVIKEEVTGIGATEYSESYKVYPNPFNDRIKISTAENIDFILITDLQGKIIYNEIVNKNSAELNLDRLSAGMFLMKIQTGNKNYIHKIIKR